MAEHCLYGTRRIGTSRAGDHLLLFGLGVLCRNWLHGFKYSYMERKRIEIYVHCTFSEAECQQQNTLRFISLRYFHLRHLNNFKHSNDSLPHYLENSVLSVSDSEVLRLDWTFSSRNGQIDEDNYTTETIASASNSCCYQYATISDNRQLLAVATSKDNILLYNIETTKQIFDYVGHTG